MLHVTVRQDVVEDGKLKTIELDRTVQELDEMPELAIGVLLQTIWERFFLIIHFGEGAKLCDELLKLQIEWVYRDPPLDKKVAYTLALQQDNSWDKGMALIRIKKSGRPVKSRHTAIKALFCKMYFGKSWQEVTQRFCQCGQSHDNKSPDNTLRFQACQGRLESEVRHLKKALKKCGVAFPPARIKGSKSPYQAGESSQSRSQDLRKTATLEESRGALRVTSEYAIPHPAIAILLDGSPMPTMNSDSHPGDGSDAWSLFNPWDRGWIPMWFPTLLGTEPIWSKEEYQRLRYNIFDKVFKRFAGSDWPPKGSLDSQRQMVARTLREMYRAVAAEQWLEIVDLKPLKL